MKKVVRLIGGLGMLILVAMLVSLVYESVFSEALAKIEDREIDTNALIYSESEKAVEGNYLLLKTE